MSAASPAKPRGRLGMVLISKSQYHFYNLVYFYELLISQIC